MPDTRSDPFRVPLDGPRPSQCYLDADRLASVVEWFDFEDPRALDPLPVLPVPDDEGWYLTDGHTRWFCAHLAGFDEVVVVRDPDEADLSAAVYEQCLTWCREADVTDVSDLTGRVVGREAFLDRWVRRCHALPAHPGDPADVG